MLLPLTPVRVSGLLLLLLAAAAGGQQDEDYQQKSTALLNWFPDEGEVVKKAAALAAAGKYVEALAIYDEALEKKPNTVISTDPSKTTNVGIREYILGQIASWPEEGKAAYRRRADPLAEHAFQGAKRARDVDALERLVDQFPFSAVVDDALALIANLRLDAGECAPAADALGKLLDRESATDRAVISARLGLAWACAGRRKELEDLTKRVERDLPNAEIQVGESRVGLAKHLKALASQVREGASEAAPLALPAWESIGGGPAGTRIAESGVELAKAAWMDVIGLPRLDGEEELIVRRSMALVPTAE